MELQPQIEYIEKETTKVKKTKSSLFYLGPTIKKYGLCKNTVRLQLM